MSMNFAGQRGPYPVQFNPGTPPSGRFRSPYQQSPPPNMYMSSHGRGSHHRDRAVTFMPNDIKIPKPPKQPDKPLPAYMRYSRKVWETVKLQHPDMKMWDIGKLIGEQWRNLPEDERQGFFAEYEVEKSEYQEAMKTYHNSTAYREWLKAKEKAQTAMQDQQMMEKMMGGAMPKEEPRFQLQQIEDDDDEAEFTTKHVAASRFQRNHRLISEIFNESTVPDIKTIVTRPRLENLKRQVQSLMQHQRKLEGEIEEMEEKFEAKKRRILDRTKEFEQNMNKFLELPSSASIDEVNDDVSKSSEESPKQDDEKKNGKLCPDIVGKNGEAEDIAEQQEDIPMETDQQQPKSTDETSNMSKKTSEDDLRNKSGNISTLANEEAPSKKETSSKEKTPSNEETSSKEETPSKEMTLTKNATPTTLKNDATREIGAAGTTKVSAKDENVAFPKPPLQ